MKSLSRKTSGNKPYPCCWHMKKLVIVLLFSLWMGGQVDTKTRKESLLSIVPNQLFNETFEQVTYASDALDSMYEAVDGTKQAVFLWGKVGLLLFAPLAQILVWSGYMMRKSMSFLWPWLEIMFDQLMICSSWFQFYLMELLAVLYRVTEIFWSNFIEQDGWNIFFEVMTPVVLIFAWMLKKLISRQRYLQRLGTWFSNLKENIVSKYQRLLGYVTKRSLAAATVVPHLIFFSPWACVIIFFQKSFRFYHRAIFHI
eukprot:TRINITY_DN15179_c0_g1_i2.p1 TRINITY_DN15179_c0_g1~~TRINITY_DN15179_c0_g1_i2.p1  ORF type:complete len:256 (-),score=34.78 TRINITY_DN15179_c0_g1_i2:4-771(-)